MKKILLIISLSLISVTIFAQNIVSAEYYFDNDPGTGNGSSLSISNGDTISFAGNANTAGLSDGLHFLYLRVKNNNGVWSMTEKQFVLVSKYAGNASDITAAEYFIDTDPGVGNGITLSTGTSSSGVVNFIASIPSASLTPGFHNFYIRVKNNDGWGLYEQRMFYVTTLGQNAPDITIAEYFIDTDPGIGNGTTISTGTSAAGTVNFVASIPSSSLSPGFHNLHIRVKNNDGWSLYEQRMFYITTQSANASDITSAEYFIDTDPGIGNGNALSTGVSTSGAVNFIASISSGSLTSGFHNLYIRVKSNDGWSLYDQKMFYVTSHGINAPDITGGEYFIDADPGVGLAAQVNFTPGSQINQTLLVNVPTGTATGKHYLYLRVKDAADIWSLYSVDSFTVTGTFPVTGLDVKASKLDNKINVEWQTLTETNADYFDVEHSSDGINFKQLGKQEAVGNSNSISKYNYLHSAPVKGLNYYRIKQVDEDGRFVYSKIVLVLFDNNKNEITLFPNPAKDFVTIKSNELNAKSTMQLFSSKGELLATTPLQSNNHRLSVSHLSAGTYYIRISDGLKTNTYTFIKQ